MNIVLYQIVDRDIFGNQRVPNTRMITGGIAFLRHVLNRLIHESQPGRVFQRYDRLPQIAFEKRDCIVYLAVGQHILERVGDLRAHPVRVIDILKTCIEIRPAAVTKNIPVQLLTVALPLLLQDVDHLSEL